MARYSQPGRHPPQSGRQLCYASLSAEGTKSISEVKLHGDVVRVCSKMCLDVVQHHETTLRSAYAKLPVLQVRLQGGPCLAQEQVTKDLGPDRAD